MISTRPASDAGVEVGGYLPSSTTLKCFSQGEDATITQRVGNRKQERKKKRNAGPIEILAAKSGQMSQVAHSRSLYIDNRGKTKMTGKVEQ